MVFLLSLLNHVALWGMFLIFFAPTVKHRREGRSARGRTKNLGGTSKIFGRGEALAPCGEAGLCYTVGRKKETLHSTMQSGL